MNAISPPVDRRGMALMTALVGIVVMGAIAAGIVQAAASHQRQMHRHRRELQANLLLDAGIDRALAQLRNRPEYLGETWSVAAGEPGDATSAEVEIQVAPADRAENEFEIAVQVAYPQHEIYRVRKSRRTTVRLEPASDAAPIAAPETEPLP